HFLRQLQRLSMTFIESRPVGEHMYRASSDIWSIVLLIDDIQCMAQKKATLEEFFLTLTALQEAGKQVVLTSNCYPRDMSLPDDRLRSRLESGVIADIGYPDLDARVAILRRRANAEGMEIDSEVLLYIATLIQSNVRTLEGALIKLIAYTSLTGKAPTTEVARGALSGYHHPAAELPLTIERIQEAVCDWYRLDPAALKGKRRDRQVLLPRQLAMYLARKATQAPLTDIGHHFGGRDHSTVISACKKIDAALQGDPQLRSILQEICQRLGISSP
ncbi:MAG: DnaA/Hda family protein, partial [Armatimonadota bacterium]|nr:DnaA/Hda family protein [Armatimonadota bacterium]